MYVDILLLSRDTPRPLTTLLRMYCKGKTGPSVDIVGIQVGDWIFNSNRLAFNKYHNALRHYVPRGEHY